MAKSPAAPPKRYTVIQRDDTDATHTLGEVSLDADSKISVVSAAPDGAETLNKIVERMNNKAVLHVDAPPPPSAPRFALASRMVKRDDPEFRSELEAQLRQYYDIELQPR
jgi:hypothetical protein